MGDEKADYLSELWARHFDSAWVGSGKFTKNQKKGAEAFAAAMWEIIYEDLPGQSSGWDVKTDGSAGALGFRARDLDTSLANQWLHSLTGAGPKANLLALTNDCKQDFLTEVPIPEPATIVMLGLGSFVIVVYTGKKSSTG